MKPRSGGWRLPTILSGNSGIVKHDLSVLEHLVDQGVPLALGYHRSSGGFTLEPQWQHNTADMSRIWRYLNGYGDMIAILTGFAYDVFDFDPQNGGFLSEFLAYYVNRVNSPLICQAICRTPSGGHHLYVNTLQKRKRPIARGIDYQGAHGIAFVPPSRKLAKVSHETVRYRWVEYAFDMEKDSGLEIFNALSAWTDHPPIQHPSHSSTTLESKSSITARLINYAQRNGLSEDAEHDNTLSGIIWYLCRSGVRKDRAYAIWENIVANTPEKNGKRPYEPKDFERHWDGAERKLR